MKSRCLALIGAVVLLSACQSTNNAPSSSRQAALDSCKPLRYSCHNAVPLAVANWTPSPEAQAASANISPESIATLQAIQVDSTYGRAWLDFQIGRQFFEQRQLVASVSYLTSATKSELLDSLEHKVALKMLIGVFTEYHQTAKAQEAIENYLAYMGDDAEPVYINLLKVMKAAK